MCSCIQIIGYSNSLMFSTKDFCSADRIFLVSFARMHAYMYLCTVAVGVVLFSKA